MKQHNREFFKLLVPKARPSIRNTSTLEMNKFHSLKHSENMYKSRQNYSNISDDSDDEEQSYDDDSDDQNHDNNRYSDESLNNSSQTVLDSFRSANSYPYTTKVYERSFHSPNTSRSLNTTINYSPKSVHAKYKNKSDTQQSNIFLCCIACVLFLGVLFIIQVVPCKNVKQETAKPEVKMKTAYLMKVDEMLGKSMQIIRTKFSNQKPSIWNDMSAAIYDVILYPTKPSIITLFGKEADTLNCLAQLLGQLSSVILNCNNYLILTPKDFPNDVGQVIYNLKAQILQKPAVIIQDLLNINTEAIRAFHNFCDRENPLVQHVIYIITMVVDDYTLSQKELEFVEKKLIRKLSGKIEKDILDPLITRLTDGIIIPILPESSTSFNRTDCSFPKEQINQLKAVIS